MGIVGQAVEEHVGQTKPRQMFIGVQHRREDQPVTGDPALFRFPAQIDGIGRCNLSSSYTAATAVNGCFRISSIQLSKVSGVSL